MKTPETSMGRENQDGKALAPQGSLLSDWCGRDL